MLCALQSQLLQKKKKNRELDTSKEHGMLTVNIGVNSILVPEHVRVGRKGWCLNLSNRLVQHIAIFFSFLF